EPLRRTERSVSKLCQTLGCLRWRGWNVFFFLAVSASQGRRDPADRGLSGFSHVPGCTKLGSSPTEFAAVRFASSTSSPEERDVQLCETKEPFSEPDCSLCAA